MLDLYVAVRTGKRVSVSSACIAAAVPGTTALRWIYKLKDLGLVETETSGPDRRMIFVRLSDTSIERMDQYLTHALRQLQSVP